MCRTYSELITPAIDNRLSEESAENLFRHLNSCYKCSSEYHSLLAVRNRLRNSQKTTQVPENLFQFVKDIPIQNEALTKISPEESYEIFKKETADDESEIKTNFLKIAVGITLTFISAGYYLLFR